MDWFYLGVQGTTPAKVDLIAYIIIVQRTFPSLSLYCHSKL